MEKIFVKSIGTRKRKKGVNKTKLRCFRCGHRFKSNKEVFRDSDNYPLCEDCFWEFLEGIWDEDFIDNILDEIKEKFNGKYNKFLKHHKETMDKCYVPKGKTEEAIKILYRKSYEEKWKEIEKGRNYPRYVPCAFCESVGSMNILGISNPKCSENCGIDPTICGSPNSLFAQLVNYHDESSLEFKEITDKIIIEIKKRGGIQS